MRSQQRAIFDALVGVAEGGTFRMDVPFLPFGDALDCVAEVTKHLMGKRVRLNRNTAQAWLRAGLLPEPARTERNRLFSGVDVIPLATMFFLTQAGVPRKLSIAFTGQVMDQFKEHIGEHWKGLQPGEPFDPEDLVYAWREGGRWGIMRGGSIEQLHGVLRLGFPTVVLPAKFLVFFVTAVVTAKWEEKARSALTNLKALRQKMQEPKREQRKGARK